jgi:DNA topoisomerase-2
MTDQDPDGSHIKGLIWNMIISRWPSLLKHPKFFMCFVTPLVRLQPLNSRLKPKLFFNMTDFEAFKASSADALKGYAKPRYLKGLGTSETEEAREYFLEIERFVKSYTPNNLETCKQTFTNAFGEQHANWRKEWLSQYNEKHLYDYSSSSFALDEFVDRELKHFSIYDNTRSLANVIDGLKVSQRKILWGLRKLQLWNGTKKVLAVSGEISTMSSYHHGEKSLMDTMVGMAQRFVGANNVNLLHPSGQFGSRLRNGDDASDARYIFTKLSPITKPIVREEDDPVR